MPKLSQEIVDRINAHDWDAEEHAMWSSTYRLAQALAPVLPVDTVPAGSDKSKRLRFNKETRTELKVTGTIALAGLALSLIDIFWIVSINEEIGTGLAPIFGVPFGSGLVMFIISWKWGRPYREFR